MTVKITITARELKTFLSREIERIKIVMNKKYEQKEVAYSPFWPFGKHTIVKVVDSGLWYKYDLSRLENRLYGLFHISDDTEIVMDEYDLLDINYGNHEEKSQ